VALAGILAAAPFGWAAAEAATFQVAAPGTIGASDVTCAPCATIQGGVNAAAAAAGPDEVVIAAGNYAESVTIAAGSEVTVTGSGAGATILDGGSSTALQLDAPATVRRLSIRGTGSPIVRLYGGTLAETRVETSAANFSLNTGVSMPAGGAGSPVLQDSAVLVPYFLGVGFTDYGVSIASTVGQPQIVRTVVQGGYAVSVDSAQPVSIVQSMVRGNVYGVYVRGVSTAVNVVGSVVEPVSAHTADGTGVANSSLASATITVVGSTVAGSGLTTGVSCSAGAGVTARIALLNTIVAGHATDLDVEGFGGGTPTLSVASSLYDPAKVTTSAGTLDTSGGGNLAGVAPGFVDVAIGDFRLAAGSAAIDAGTAALAAGEPDTDLAGAPRLADGDGNGTVLHDLGAYEYEYEYVPPPPDVSAPAATIDEPACPGRPRAHRACLLRRASWSTLTGTATDPDPGSGIARVEVRVLRLAGAHCLAYTGSGFARVECDDPSSGWRPATVSGSGQSVTWTLALGGVRPGRYSLRVRAVDAEGNVQEGFPAGAARMLRLR
jgi:hypothetical protein